MLRAKYEGKHGRAKEKTVNKTYKSRFCAIAITVMLLLGLAVGGTVAWLSTDSGPVENSFTYGNVSCEVTESFSGTVKSNVNVKNTGNIDAYIRVKLVTYRTNDEGNHIGGAATIPTFTLGSDWVFYDGYYYYTLPVASGATPTTNLADSITLTNEYTDADGGHQAIDVVAEAIQSNPAKAVGEAWGVSISQGTVSPYTAA